MKKLLLIGLGAVLLSACKKDKGSDPGCWECTYTLSVTGGGVETANDVVCEKNSNEIRNYEVENSTKTPDGEVTTRCVLKAN